MEWAEDRVQCQALLNLQIPLSWCILFVYVDVTFHVPCCEGPVFIFIKGKSKGVPELN